jgi:hypothetical protein
MSLWILCAFTALVTFSDLMGAMFYAADPQHLGLDVLRLARDGIAICLSAWGVVRGARAGWPFTLSCSYFALIGLYVIGSRDDIGIGIVLASAAKLAFPLLFVWIGFGMLTSPRDLRRYSLFLAILACLSAAFGAWDIRNTEFWTETLEYGHYLNGVKGIITGFDSYYVLPFNFFGFEEVRRAAGLVAAPLAQGSFVAVGSLLGFAAMRRRSLVLALAILAIGVLGVWQSGTRGAMLLMAIALPFFLLVGTGTSNRSGNLVLFALIAVGTLDALVFVLNYTINLEDGSTIGHLNALVRNIEDLDTALLLGPGLGASGSIAADVGIEIEGGGEGAIFSVIYQIGMPGALILVAFYAVVSLRVFRNRKLMGPSGDICLACAALALGITSSFVTSDHLFSLSGLGVFWIILGGALAQSGKAPVGAS